MLNPAKRPTEPIRPPRGGAWRLALLALAAIGAGGFAQDAGGPARTIRVVLDDNYAPYSFRAGDGRLQGILIDQWQAWEKRTGIRAELRAMDWGEAVRRMRAGEFDVIDAIVATPERRAEFEFTPVYATVEVPIFFRGDVSGITDLASLRGFPVGVKAGDQHVEKLEAAGVTTLIPFPNYDAMIAAAGRHKINVFVADAPAAIYLLHKAGLAAEFRHSAPVFRDGLQRAVRKGNDALAQEVEDGFAALAPGDLSRIDEKWFGRTLNRYGDYLATAGYAAGAALLLIAGLIGWNRTLQRRVRQRTAALSESEARFRQIAGNIREVVWLGTVDWSKTLYVSPAYEAVWGRSCASLYRDPRSFLAAIHPDDRARAGEAVDRNRAHGFNVEYRIVRPDGSLRWVRDRGFPIREGDAPADRVAGITEDITERKLAAEAGKRAEDRIRLIIDTIPMMAWSVRPDGVVDFLNRRWLEYAGLTLEEYVKDPMVVLHPEDVPRAVEKWLASLATGEAYEDEMRLRRADGKYRWFLVRTAPLRDAAGAIVRWFGSSVDIEDRKEAMEALRHSERQLHALVGRLHTVREDEAKRIARELHDDLGQKLTALNMALAELDLKLTAATPGQREQIARMHATVDQTVEVVQKLASELRLGQLDILGLTAAIEWQLQEFARRSGIACDVLRLDEIDRLSDAQRTAVFRILQEALTNVVRHAGARRVTVSLEAGADRVILRIHDDGRGIAPAERNDRKAIGLLGMRERAQGVGGDVVIAGEPGRGTTVLVTIPRQPNGRIHP